MRFSTLTCALATLPLLAQSAPFLPQDGLLQRNRRRAVDYPINFAEPRPVPRNRKRSEEYNVVQVDGGSNTSKAPERQTIIQKETIKPPSKPASQVTKTLVYTSVIQGPKSEETTVVTTTQAIPQTVTAVASPSQVTTTEKDSDSPDLVVSTKINYSTAYDVLTTTLPASTVTASSSVQYYDDGMWHTSYAVKKYAPPSRAEATPQPAPEVQGAAEIKAEGASQSHGSNAEPCEKRDNSGTPYNYIFSRQRRSTSPASEGSNPGIQNAPVPIVKDPSQPTKTQKQKRNPVQYSKAAGVVSPTEPAEAPKHKYFRIRNAPSDLKVKSWNITDIDEINKVTG